MPQDDFYGTNVSTEIPVDSAPAGTPNDIDRSFQAAQSPAVAAPLITKSIVSHRGTMFLGELLVISGVVGGAVISTVEPSASGITNQPVSLWASPFAWLAIAALVLVGIVLMVQAWRLSRTLD